MPIPFLGIAGALAAAATAVAVCKVIKYSCDYLSQQECERRDRMNSHYRSYVNDKRSELSGVYQNRESRLAGINQYEANQREMLFRNHAQDKKDARYKYFYSIIDEIEGQLKEKEELVENINKIRNTLNDFSKNGEFTIMRKTSIENYKTSLNETYNKLKAYKGYIYNYKKYLRAMVENVDVDLPPPFEVMIPDSMPYVGKLMLIKKSDIEEEGNFTVEPGIKIPYYCEDLKNYNNVDENSVIPVFVSFYDAKKYMFVLSLTKGVMKYTTVYNQRVGLECKVTRCEENKIYLKYLDMELVLFKKNLQNPRRTPPRGSELRVYPLQWDYYFKYPIVVTERFEQSIKLTDFSTIPILSSSQQCLELQNYILKNKVEFNYDEWKIGPMDSDFINNNMLKLQLGGRLVIKVEIIFIGEDKVYLLYKELMKTTEIFKTEDVFATINASLKYVINDEFEEFSNEDYLHLYDLYNFLINEFKSQEMIIKNRDGSRYYYIWTQILENYLVQYSKNKENSITCSIDKVINTREDRFSEMVLQKYSVYNAEDVKKRISKVKNEFGRSEFFYEHDDGKRIPIEFSATGETITLIQEDYDNILANKESIDIYKRETDYPVVQQKKALMNFRQGNMINMKLKEYLLNTENVEFTDTNFKIDNFYNTNILKNISQREAVEKALAEKHFFMIQGPPGTGKTTVIIEIIRQYISKNPKHKVIVLSQTNVAVDNVIERLIKINDEYFNEDTMIRCGNKNKIKNEAVLPILFSSKYNYYVNNVRNTAVRKKDNEAFRQKWIKDVVDNYGAEGILGELILSQNKIVGATCIGLASRRIGLNEVDFDLAVIDEAGKALPGELLVAVLKSKKVILIGDHKQLPPTINEKLKNLKVGMDEVENFEEVKNELFQTSIFERLYESCPDSNRCMLGTQFRMPAVIGNIISRLFYKGMLASGDNTYSKLPIYHDKNMNFIDTANDNKYQLKKDSNGNINLREIEIVVDLIGEIRKNHKNKIAVITPYRPQSNLLMNKLVNISDVRVDTIDGYQGDEADIVIFATTRDKFKTDFFSDFPRINVALSRTIRELIIIGSSTYFKTYGENHPLYEIMSEIEKNGNIIKIGGEHEHEESDFKPTSQ